MRPHAIRPTLAIAALGTTCLAISGCAWFGGRSDPPTTAAAPTTSAQAVPVLRLGAADDMGWSLLQQEHQRLAWATSAPSHEPTRTATGQTPPID